MRGSPSSRSQTHLLAAWLCNTLQQCSNPAEFNAAVTVSLADAEGLLQPTGSSDNSGPSGKGLDAGATAVAVQPAAVATQPSLSGFNGNLESPRQKHFSLPQVPSAFWQGMPSGEATACLCASTMLGDVPVYTHELAACCLCSIVKHVLYWSLSCVLMP